MQLKLRQKKRRNENTATMTPANMAMVTDQPVRLMPLKDHICKTTS